jgi:DNA-binding Xre family transcriptional regulator
MVLDREINVDDLRDHTEINRHSIHRIESTGDRE